MEQVKVKSAPRKIFSSVSIYTEIGIKAIIATSIIGGVMLLKDKYQYQSNERDIHQLTNFTNVSEKSNFSEEYNTPSITSRPPTSTVATSPVSLTTPEVDPYSSSTSQYPDTLTTKVPEMVTMTTYPTPLDTMTEGVTSAYPNTTDLIDTTDRQNLASTLSTTETQQFTTSTEIASTETTANNVSESTRKPDEKSNIGRCTNFGYGISRNKCLQARKRMNLTAVLQNYTLKSTQPTTTVRPTTNAPTTKIPTTIKIQVAPVTPSKVTAKPQKTSAPKPQKPQVQKTTPKAKSEPVKPTEQSAPWYGGLRYTWNRIFSVGNILGQQH